MKIIIIDDHPLVRKGLISILSLEESIEVLGEAKNTKEAIQLINICEPDIVIVDVRLGNESGLDFVTDTIKRGYTSKFVVFTSSPLEKDFKKAKEIGVDGYVLKEALPEELIHALKIISKGRKYYDPGMYEFLMKSRELQLDSEINQLTPKEKEVLIELGKGYSNKEIAQNLYITEYTVKKHVSQILAKLELTDRTQAALYANAKGLVTYIIN